MTWSNIPIPKEKNHASLGTIHPIKTKPKPDVKFCFSYAQHLGPLCNLDSKGFGYPTPPTAHLSTHSSSLRLRSHFPHAALLDRNCLVLVSLMSWRFHCNWGFPLTIVLSGCLYWNPNHVSLSLASPVFRDPLNPASLASYKQWYHMDDAYLCHILLKIQPSPWNYRCISVFVLTPR